MRIACLAVVFGFVTITANQSRPGVLLEALTWQEAERILTPGAVVVIPMGAQAKEHGPHLKLNNDFVMAEYFKNRVLNATDVVMAPTINYGFYPAFVDYPGSTTVPLDAARETVISIVKTLAAHGPTKFYILNTGVSTVRALTPAAEALAKDGITMTFFNWSSIDDVDKTVLKQPEGTHADEGETSMMLFIAPQSVDMTKAVRDIHAPNGTGPLRRREDQPGRYSPSGSFGDPTLATREKGRVLTEAALGVMLKDIAALRAVK